MAKGRDKVQQLGFFDAEVADPDHDRVQLWAYEQAEMIFRAVHPELFECAWRREEILPWKPIGGSPELQRERAAAFARENPRPDPKVAKKTLEFVLRRSTGYQERYTQIVGYADLLLETSLPVVDCDDKNFQAVLEWREGPRVLVEAKAKLPTLGELMRQLQLYRTAFGGKLALVSPDDSYARVLEEQGVVFIKYDLRSTEQDWGAPRQTVSVP